MEIPVREPGDVNLMHISSDSCIALSLLILVADTHHPIVKSQNSKKK